MDSFPDGFSIVVGKQIYRPIGLRQRLTPDGSIWPVVDWATKCPACGVEFVVFTRLAFRWPVRRCDSCKAPGRRVASGRSGRPAKKPA